MCRSRLLCAGFGSSRSATNGSTNIARPSTRARIRPPSPAGSVTSSAGAAQPNVSAPLVKRPGRSQPTRSGRMVDAVEDKVRLLADADPKTKAALYASLGVSLCYEHDRRVVTVEARQPGHVHNERVGGTTRHPKHTCPVESMAPCSLRRELLLAVYRVERAQLRNRRASARGRAPVGRDPFVARHGPRAAGLLEQLDRALAVEIESPTADRPQRRVASASGSGGGAKRPSTIQPPGRRCPRQLRSARVSASSARKKVGTQTQSYSSSSSTSATSCFRSVTRSSSEASATFARPRSRRRIPCIDADDPCGRPDAGGRDGQQTDTGPDIEERVDFTQLRVRCDQHRDHRRAATPTVEDDRIGVCPAGFTRRMIERSVGLTQVQAGVQGHHRLLLRRKLVEIAEARCDRHRAAGPRRSPGAPPRPIASA